MFSSSTHRKSWLFKNEHELNSLRRQANAKFIQAFGNKIPPEKRRHFFLSAEEEFTLCKFYEVILRDFCKKFKPAMPRSVVGTSFHYYKRFYLHNSVMDYHPKHIVVTCVYLAAKVEEFNLSITQFVENVKGDREKAVDIILNNELLLMQQLNYNLTIHNPYRPIEGLLIDIKTRYQTGSDPERLRPIIDAFLDDSLFTDACLLYAPSQIALAAITNAAKREGEDFTSYITDILFQDSPDDKLIYIEEAIQDIKKLVVSKSCPAREIVKPIEKKLEKCRNQENNPDSEIYKRKQQELLNEDDGEMMSEYARISEEQHMDENVLLQERQ